MFYVFIFDFALGALLLCSVVFFVWCWIAFRQDGKAHPIYLQAAPTRGKAHVGEGAQRSR